MPSRVSPPLAPLQLPTKAGVSMKSDVASTRDVTIEPSPRTIDELMRARCAEAPDHPIFAYPTSGIDYDEYTYQQLDQFAYQAALSYVDRIPKRASSAVPETVVGLLGPSNLDYLITLLALTKLGHTVLFLSTRISEAAYVSLLRGTSAKHVLIDASFQQMAEQVQNSLPDLQVHKIVGQQRYRHATEKPLETRLDLEYDLDAETDKTAWIIHSSGYSRLKQLLLQHCTDIETIRSTGLPKPIYQTHAAAIINYSTNMNMRGFVTLPLYHAHGLSSTFRAFHSRKQIHIYNAAIPLRQADLIAVMQKYHFEILYGVPYALKLLGETTEGIEVLKPLRVVMFGGSSCPDSLGEKLVQSGVNLISHYGTTETGQLMTSFRPAGDLAWDYVRPPAKLKPYIRWEQHAPGIYELSVLDGWPSKVASNRPDGSYATKDLFTPHLTIPDAWKYYARLDDTIVLMNGEKANPLVVEGAVREDPNVTEAVAFGANRSALGLMVIPSHPDKNIVDQIWPAVEYGNSIMPAYAQLSREMIKVLPYGTGYPRTDKGTVIRQAFYKQFSQEIESAYADEANTGTLVLSEIELEDFLRTEIVKTLSVPMIANDTDFFSVGMDSLQAIQIRSALLKTLDIGGKKLGQNVVFDYPNITALATHISQLRDGSAIHTVPVEEKMESLISKYSTFEQHVPAPANSAGRTVIVTGATGSLGAHIVSVLAQMTSVKTIYCFVRATSAEHAHLRVTKSLRERCVYDDLSTGSREKTVSLPTDLSKPSFALDPTTLDHLTSSVTDIIHCAWTVNFNYSLESFEPDCIAGTHNLISLCLRAKQPHPATFTFCSSVSAVANTPPGRLITESLPPSLTHAQSMGYAQSKLVTEHICALASQHTTLNTNILRIGQIISDTVHGIWNTTEAIPLIFQSALSTGVLPALSESPLWLPVDTVAKTIVEIASSGNSSGFRNIVNPRSFHWTRDLLPMLRKAGLEFEAVPQREWIKRLRSSDPDPRVNPSIKLVEFFAGKYDRDEKREGLRYETTKAEEASSSLANVGVVDQSLVDKMVRYLKGQWAEQVVRSERTL